MWAVISNVVFDASDFNMTLTEHDLLAIAKFIVGS